MSKCLPCGRRACAGTPLASRTRLDRHPGIPRKGSVPAHGVGLHSPICSEVEGLSSLPLPLPEPRAQVAARFAFACLVVPLGILLPPRSLPTLAFTLAACCLCRCSVNQASPAARRRGAATLLPPSRASLRAGVARSSSHPSRSPRSKRRQRRSSSSSWTKVWGCPPRISNTTLRRWSMRSAVRWINGEAFAIPTTGASHPKPLGCFSIGGTMTSATSALSSAGRSSRDGDLADGGGAQGRTGRKTPP